MQIKRQLKPLLAVLALVFAGSTGAQALNVDVVTARNARITHNDNVVLFKAKPRNRKARAVFHVSLVSNLGLAGPSSQGTTDVHLLVVKRNGKRNRAIFQLEGSEHNFAFRNKRAVVLEFFPRVVPEPGSLAMLGLGLGGLALFARRRS